MSTLLSKLPQGPSEVNFSRTLWREVRTTFSLLHLTKVSDEITQGRRELDIHTATPESHWLRAAPEAGSVNSLTLWPASHGQFECWPFWHRHRYWKLARTQ